MKLLSSREVFCFFSFYQKKAIYLSYGSKLRNKRIFCAVLLAKSVFLKGAVLKRKMLKIKYTGSNYTYYQKYNICFYDVYLFLIKVRL